MARKVPDVDVRAVWDAWVKTRPRPKSCRFTDQRKKLIRNRLGQGYSVGDLVAVIRFMAESNDGLARWMRGENPNKREYMDLENLFRQAKLGGRVEIALNWLAGDEKSPDGDDLGPIGRWVAEHVES